ncbi:MAG: IPT/TIG domain-containing protein [Candidatus Aminicenantes bacterium]|nr:IPT/TIG domain-containing protein [Candidatus Aminicenantes bacterium]
MKTRVSVFFFAALFLALSAMAVGQNPKPQVPQKIDTVKIPVLAPRISSVKCTHDGSPIPEIDLSGLAFGAARGSRRVMMDGVPATNYLHWTNTGITIGPPITPVIKWTHEYTFAIDDGAGNILSNQFKVKFLIDWDGASPGSAAPGTEITLNGWGPGPNLGGKVLMMDNVALPILGWTGSPSATQIRTRVPAIAAGPHRIFFMDGGVKASKDLSFTVL